MRPATAAISKERHVMEPLEVQREYAALLSREPAYGALPAGGAELERRQCPRFHVCTSDLWINQVPEFAVLDLSATGIAISSTYPLERGTCIEVTLCDGITVQAEVIGCRLVDSPTQYYPADFRIQCRFSEPRQGMELLVRAKQREQARRSRRARTG
jgi:PilZ domain